MEFERLRRNHSTPNLTPLIDIVFLLLVFFMLTAHFVRDESIAIELPQAESSVDVNDEEMLEIVINQHGETLLMGERVALTEIESRLHLLLQDQESKSVSLRGDRDAKLEVIVAILDAARKAGADAVDIITDKP